MAEEMGMQEMLERIMKNNEEIAKVNEVKIIYVINKGKDQNKKSYLNFAFGLPLK